MEFARLRALKHVISANSCQKLFLVEMEFARLRALKHYPYRLDQHLPVVEMEFARLRALKHS